MKNIFLYVIFFSSFSFVLHGPEKILYCHASIKYVDPSVKQKVFDPRTYKPIAYEMVYEPVIEALPQIVGGEGFIEALNKRISLKKHYRNKTSYTHALIIDYYMVFSDNETEEKIARDILQKLLVNLPQKNFYNGTK